MFWNEDFVYCRYAYLENHKTEQIVGSTDDQPLLETPGEVSSSAHTRENILKTVSLLPVEHFILEDKVNLYKFCHYDEISG